MSQVGSVEITVKLGLEQMLKDAAAVQRELDKKLQDHTVKVNLDNSLLGKINAQAQGFEDAVAQAQSYTLALGEVGSQLLQTGQQINQFTNQAAQAAIAFDSARAKVATLSSDSEGLANRMRELSGELGFQSNSTELLNASYDVLSSGISDTADVANVLKASTEGALGGFSDVGTVSDAVTTLISAYKNMGASAADAGRFVDILAQTQDRGKITIGQYASQIGQVASTAALAGVGIEEMSAAVATATAKGQDAGGAISGVRQAIVNLLKPTDEAQRYLEKFGITNSAAMLKTEGLVGILEKLKTGGASTDELAKIFSDVTGLATVSTLAGANLNDFKGNLDAMSNSAGKAAKSAEQVANSMQGKLNAAMNQSSEALVDLGNGVTKAIGPLLDALVVLVTNFNELPTPVKEATGAVIAIGGGLVTLAGALAAVAAVLPVIGAGFTALTASFIALSPAGLAAAGAVTATGTAVTGATAATVGLGAAMVSFLPVLAAVAAGVALIAILQKIKEFGNAQDALDALSQSVQANANGAISAAGRTSNAIKALNKSRADGSALTKQEIGDAKALVKANGFRITQLQQDLALAQQLPVLDEQQANAKTQLVASTAQAIKVLQGQNAELEKLVPVTKKAAAANAEVAASAETIAAKYEQATALIESANSLRLAEIAEAARAGTLTEAQAQAASLQQEAKYQNDRLKLTQAKLDELNALKDVTKDPAKLKELNKGVVEAEQALSDTRLAIANNGIAQRQAAEAAALSALEDSISTANAKIAGSKTSRVTGVKRSQLSGDTSDADAARQIAAIEQDSIAQTIRARQAALVQIRAQQKAGLVGAQDAAAKEAELITSLGDLTLQQTESELNAQRAAQAEALQGLREGTQAQTEAAQLTATNKITAIKQAQAAGVLGEQQAAEQIAAINQASTDQAIALKLSEIAKIQAARAAGTIDPTEAASLEKAAIAEVAQLRQQSAEQDIAQAQAVKAVKLDALDAEMAGIQTAAEMRAGANQLQIEALNQQGELLSAQSNVMEAQAGLAEQRLQFAIDDAEAAGKTTEAEKLKKQLLSEQIRTQQQQAQIAQTQLRLKQEQNRFELENAQISANIALSEAQIAVEKARINGATQIELNNLLQIQGLRAQQVSALQAQGAAQSQLNALEAQALGLQQQKTAEALKQQQIVANNANLSADVRAGGAQGRSSGSSNASSSSSFSGQNLADRLTDLGNKGNLADSFNAAGASLVARLGTGSANSGMVNAGRSDVSGKLDQLIAATRDAVGRPNLSIQNVDDLGMAGKIYSDISRSSARGAGL